ncbi:amidase signature domain-containing protein [Phaeosphaeria sp. MPI-PUGE-AT-0046c]|nr:amidase signature domain-containing protein [Phaeosphaeria sp. MPI-PUGE-AT-0046c]
MSLTKFAKTYAANQAKYAHLNAFTVRADLQPFVERATLSHSDDADDWHSVDGKPVAIKDNICTQAFQTTAASGMLKDFTSPYNATVVDLLHEAGAVVVGKTNMDEFGMGSHSVHSHTGPVVMERHQGEAASAGGSSGGSAVAVATGQCWAALGTDTGGSVRLPAAYTGVVGFKPSYGLLSRWGVIDYANSLDTVGIIAANVAGVRSVFAKLNVHDPKDPTSLPPATRARIKSRESDDRKSLRIGIPLDYNISTLDPVIRGAWARTLKFLALQGHTLHPVRLPATQHALSAYYVLAPAEASSNLAKYDGVRFGTRADGIDGSPESVLFAKTRGQGFGSEVQRRILLGAFSLSAQAIDNYFIQAQKVRRIVQEDFDNVFAQPNPLRTQETSSTLTQGKVDLLLCPTAPTLAPSLSKVKDEDPLQAYMNDVFTVPASLAGLPAISVPIRLLAEEQWAKYGDEKFPATAGMQIIGQYGDDDLVLRVGHQLRKARSHEQRHVGLDPNAWGHSRMGDMLGPGDKKYRSYALQLGSSVAEAKKIVQPEQEKLYAEMAALLIDTVGEERLAAGAKYTGQSCEHYLRRLSEDKDPLGAEEVVYKRIQMVNETAETRIRRVQSAGTIKEVPWTKLENKVEALRRKQEEELEAFEGKHQGEEVKAFKAKQREEIEALERKMKLGPIRFVGIS